LQEILVKRANFYYSILNNAFFLAGKFSFKRLPLTLPNKYKCVIFNH